jgi:hypothetical protein
MATIFQTVDSAMKKLDGLSQALSSVAAALTTASQSIEALRSGLLGTVDSTSPTEELFGHVTLVEVYETPTFRGAHALLALRDTPGKQVMIFTRDTRMTALLLQALATKFQVAIWSRKLTAPLLPLGGTPSVDQYGTSGGILYSSP